jgi:hypothetical protein
VRRRPAGDRVCAGGAKGWCQAGRFEGNGSDLRQLIAQRQDFLEAYLQMKAEKREEQ